jgi:hypothetical protein
MVSSSFHHCNKLSGSFSFCGIGSFQPQVGIAEQRVGQGQWITVSQELLPQLPEDLCSGLSLKETIQEGAGEPIPKDHVHGAFGAKHTTRSLFDKEGDEPIG